MQPTAAWSCTRWALAACTGWKPPARPIWCRCRAWRISRPPAQASMTSALRWPLAARATVRVILWRWSILSRTCRSTTGTRTATMSCAIMTRTRAHGRNVRIRFLTRLSAGIHRAIPRRTAPSYSRRTTSGCSICIGTARSGRKTARRSSLTASARSATPSPTPCSETARSIAMTARAGRW